GPHRSTWRRCSRRARRAPSSPFRTRRPCANSRAATCSGRMRLVRWFPPLYNDRAEGGRALAGAVAALALEEPVVVGVARGGVAVAVEVARALDAPLTAVDVERVNARGFRLGAVTAAGPAYVHEDHRVPEHEVRVALER